MIVLHSAASVGKTKTSHFRRSGQSHTSEECYKGIDVLRGELAGRTRQPSCRETESADLSAEQREFRHTLKNHLSSLNTALAQFEKQVEAGLLDDANITYGRLLAILQQLDQSDPTAPTLPPVTPASSGQTSKATKQLRALLVEDGLDERELLAGFLRMCGYAVDTAGDGYEAMAYLAKNQTPDFVLLDMRMPRCDGVETIELIRSNPDLNDLRVFAVTGTPREELGIREGAGSVDRWIEKPVRPERLLQELDSYLHSSQV